MNIVSDAEKKASLRIHMTLALKDLPQSECTRAGKMIWQSIYKHIVSQIVPKERRAWCIGIFYPILGEPDFLYLHHLESALNIKCVFPVVLGERFRYYRPRSTNDFARGPLGISQPSSDAFAVDPEEIDMMLVPGLAFDHKRNRLGRGKGYYDRYISDIADDKKPIAIGVGHSFQIHREIVSQEHDMQMDYVVAPEMII